MRVRIHRGRGWPSGPVMTSGRLLCCARVPVPQQALAPADAPARGGGDRVPTQPTTAGPQPRSVSTEGYLERREIQWPN